MIPLENRKLHFMYGLWDDKPMPVYFKTELKAWTDTNPGWQVKVWNKTATRDVWASTFPEYADFYDSITPIQRADLGRLAIVYAHGGLYADLDCSNHFVSVERFVRVSKFDPVNHDAWFLVEYSLTRELLEKSMKIKARRGKQSFHTQLANYVFWAKPGNAHIRRALDFAVVRTHP